jgi:MoxR-like ATPase
MSANIKQAMESGDPAGIEALAVAHDRITGELSKVIVGQQSVIEEILVAILAGGHCLLEGVPGLAKTLLIQSLSQALSLSFKRIQFTPDLMPSDITGTDVIQDDPETGERKFKFLPGPIFANIILADEINRTPPKTQAAMLEAMQERQVSAGGQARPLPKPFFVLATQNPLEQEGTYPLPEAQQDRFLFKIFVDYPSEAEEKMVVRRVAERQFGIIEPVLSGEDILAAQELVSRVPVADAVVDYAMAIVRATRPKTEGAPEFTEQWIAWGCGPRASINLITAGKVVAALRGGECVACEDVAKIVPSVMRHRIGLNYTARAEGITPEDIATRLLEHVKAYA